MEEAPLGLAGLDAPEPAPVRCMLGNLWRLCWVAFSFWCFRELEETVPESEDSGLVWDMPPTAWERRYVRLSNSRAQEVALVRRGNRAGWWIAVFPDRTLKQVRITDKKTLMTQMPAQVYTAPLGVLTQGEKTGILQTANQGILNGQQYEDVAAYDPKKWQGVRGALSVVTSLPALGSKTIRWISRSYYRSAGTLCVLFFLYETMQHLAVFDTLNEIVRTVQVRWDLLLTTIAEANETWKSWIEDAREFYESVSKVMTPWRLFWWPFMAIFTGHLWWTWPRGDEEEGEQTTRVWWRAPSAESISSTPATTPEVEPTPPTTPRQDPQTAQVLTAVQSLLETQKETIEMIREQETQRQAEAAADSIRGTPHQWGPADQKMLNEMSAKVERWADYLEADRARKTPPLEQPLPRAGGSTPLRSNSVSPIIPEDVPLDTEALRPSTPEKRTGGPAQEGSGDPSTVKKTRTDSMEQKHRLNLLKKAERQTAAIFKTELAKLEDWDEDFIRENFPGPYKARVAPGYLTHVFQHNKKAREYALDFLRDRELTDCKDAYQGLVGPLTAIDKLLFSEPPLENFINHEGVELQAKKSYATEKAFERVQKESDWKKPAGAGGSKGWKSKVDWREASLIDPEMKQDTGVVQLREVEEESRKEIDREAILIKSKQKLAEGSRNKEGAP